MGRVPGRSVTLQPVPWPTGSGPRQKTSVTHNKPTLRASEDLCPGLGNSGRSCQEDLFGTSLRQMGPGWCPRRKAGAQGHVPEATERVASATKDTHWHVSLRIQAGAPSGLSMVGTEAQQSQARRGKAKLKIQPQTSTETVCLFPAASVHPGFLAAGSERRRLQALLEIPSLVPQLGRGAAASRDGRVLEQTSGVLSTWKQQTVLKGAAGGEARGGAVGKEPGVGAIPPHHAGFWRYRKSRASRSKRAPWAGIQEQMSKLLQKRGRHCTFGQTTFETHARQRRQGKKSNRTQCGSVGTKTEERAVEIRRRLLKNINNLVRRRT